MELEILSNNSNNNKNKNCLNNGNLMPVSTSQIFAQAAAFHISQNDTVVYSRETIHYLAKFLATHGDNKIFEKLYQYAPDNLAWFWCFFDFDCQIDVDTQVQTQEYYAPFKSNCDLDDDQLKIMNKLFSESPLIQYRYREQIMIADVFKFIEHVHKVQVTPISKALFLLYFPRFAPYMTNSLKDLVNVKLLKSNISRIKSADSIVASLIKTRYPNLNDYKQKILTGTQLPSYIHSLLIENGFYSSSTTSSSSNTLLNKQQLNDENNNSIKNSIYLSSFFNEFNNDIQPKTNKLNNINNEFNLIDNILNKSSNVASNCLNDYCGSIEASDSVFSDNDTETAIYSKSSPISPPRHKRFLKASNNSNNNNNNNNNNKQLESPTSHLLDTNSSIWSSNGINLPQLTNNTTTSSSNSPTPSISNNALTPEPSLFDEDNLARYLKHSAFISSPIARFTLSKLTDTWSSNAKSSHYTSPYHNHNNHTSRRHNSIIESSSTFNYDSPLHQQQRFKAQSLIWTGRLPPKIYQETSIYSRKVFLGGLPWDVDQTQLVHSLQKYGSVKIEIPGKDQKHPRVSTLNKTHDRATPGYVYIIYEHESAVQKMLFDCRKEIRNGGEHYYYTIYIPPNPLTNNKRGKAKEVEVIPWNQDDTSYVPQKNLSLLPSKIDSRSTIFVGALHGMLNAHGLAKVMNEVFGEVIHAGLDTDKYKYPIGSGRVTFRNRNSYIKAIKSKFVTIKANQQDCDPSPKFEKMIQIDPYLEDAKCISCDSRSTFFCRNELCLDYWCGSCWLTRHDTKLPGEHNPLSRQNK